MRSLALAALFLAAAVAGGGPPGLSPAETARIREVHGAYRAAWLANDEARVLALFTADAVLLPHHGVEPVVGEAAIRAFWFPKGAAPTTVTELEQPIDEIGGSCDVAYIRGHSRVAWITGLGKDAKAASNAGTFLTLLRRQPDGSWKITHQMWDDPPPRPR